MKWISNLVAAALLSFATLGAQAETVVEYIHTDALGSPVVVTDVNQNVVERSEYEPYGRLLNRPVSDGLGYTGHVSDAATGLAYMQQRYYDAEIGRFLSVDPVTTNSKTGGNFNRYWYANNNPYRFIDPDGRYVCTGSRSACTNFEKALEQARKASGSARLTGGEKNILKTVVEFYGKNRENNGVAVSFREKGLVQGTALRRTDGGADITLVAGKSLQEHGRDIVHEGSHGVDDKVRGRSIETRAERKETEIKAYAAQAYFQKAENFSTSWNDGWSVKEQRIVPENIERQAESSVRRACGQTASGSCGN